MARYVWGRTLSIHCMGVYNTIRNNRDDDGQFSALVYVSMGNVSSTVLFESDISLAI